MTYELRRLRLTKSVPLPTIQSETWLVHAEIREPHLNPPVRMNFLPLALVLKGKARKVHTNRGVQMWFANLRVNQPCFRLDCRGEVLTKLISDGLGVLKPGCFKQLVVGKFYAEALFCALLRSFVPFCALLRTFADLRLRSFVCTFALFCTHLRVSASDRPRLGLQIVGFPGGGGGCAQKGATPPPPPLGTFICTGISHVCATYRAILAQ